VTRAVGVERPECCFPQLVVVVVVRGTWPPPPVGSRARGSWHVVPGTHVRHWSTTPDHNRLTVMNIPKLKLLQLERIMGNRASTSGKFSNISKKTVLLCVYDDWKVYVGVATSLDGDGNPSGYTVHRKHRTPRDLVDVVWTRPFNGSYSTATQYTYTHEFDTMLSKSVYVLSEAFLNPKNDMVMIPSPVSLLVDRLLAGERLESPTKYLAEKKLYDTEKVNLNIALAKYAENMREKANRVSRKETHALYLDAATAFTTSKLLEYTNYKVSQLHAPNDDQKTCMKLSEKFPKLDAQHMSIGAFEEGFCEELPGLSFVWIDGMGTWNGRKGSDRSTKMDVRNLFRYKMLAPYAVVAYSVSTRGVKAPNEHKKCLRDVRFWMGNCGRKYNTLKPAFYVVTGGVFTTILIVKQANIRKH